MNEFISFENGSNGDDRINLHTARCAEDDASLGRMGQRYSFASYLNVSNSEAASNHNVEVDCAAGDEFATDGIFSPEIKRLEGQPERELPVRRAEHKPTARPEKDDAIDAGEAGKISGRTDFSETDAPKKVVGSGIVRLHGENTCYSSAVLPRRRR